MRPVKKGQKLKAFLLAAGRGERLRPLTDTTPKCLLPINGTPLLQIWLEHLERSSVDEVLINTHWLHEAVEAFVDGWTSRYHKMKVSLFHEPALLGSAGTLLANREWAGEKPFFIIYADNLTRLDLRKMMLFHEKHRQPLTIRVYQGADPQRAGIVCLGEKDIVVAFEEKPANPKSDLGAGGIYIGDNRMYTFFPEPEEIQQNSPFDLSRHVLPRMVGNMQAYLTAEVSIDIGTIASYEKARKLYTEILSS